MAVLSRIRLDVTVAACVFWLLFAGMVLLGDTGLYVVAWQRSILAQANRQINYNRRLDGRQPYDALDTTLNVENDGLYGYTDRQITLETLNGQSDQQQHRIIEQFDSQYRDCPDLRKLIRLPNTTKSAADLTMQQVLSDQTLNFFHCIFTGRYNARTPIL